MVEDSRSGALESVLRGRARDVDGFAVSRISPALTQKQLGAISSLTIWG